MIAVSLIHVAILTNFAYSHAADAQFNIRAAVKANSSLQTCFPGRRTGDETESSVEKIVLRETTLCEKYGIGTEPAAVPDEETITLANKARHFVSSIDWIAQRKEAPAPKPDIAIRANWTKRFAVQWDDDGGFSFGGKYFPKPEPNSTCLENWCGGGSLPLGFEINR
jgi:hypothetical protein